MVKCQVVVVIGRGGLISPSYRALKPKSSLFCFGVFVLRTIYVFDFSLTFVLFLISPVFERSIHASKVGQPCDQKRLQLSGMRIFQEPIM